MNVLKKITGLLAFGLLVVACNTAPPPPAEPRFKLEPGVASLEISPGSEASSFVALNRNAGFNDTVQMTFQNLPAGFEQEWTRDSSNGDCGVRLKVGKNVAPGEYNLSLVGLTGPEAKADSNVVSRAATVEVSTSLKVLVPDLSNLFPFSFTTSPTVFSAEPGFSAKFGINIKQIKPGFEEDVQLSVQNLPLGVTASFARNPVRVLTGTSSTQVTLTIAANTLPGTYAMKVVGTAPSKTLSSVVQLTVLPATTQGFKLSTTDVRNTFMQESGNNQDGQFGLSLERKAGFSAPVTLSVQNVPADMQVSLSKETLSGSSTGASIGVRAGFASQPGTHTFTIKGTGGGVVNTIPVTVTVLGRFDLPETSNTGTNALDSNFSNIPVPGFRLIPELKSPNQFFENGSLFNTSLVDQPFAALALPDGKVLTSAGFGNQVARLNSDGTLDSSFGTNGLSAQMGAGGRGVNNITKFALQPDNKILVGGTEVLSDIDGNISFSTAFARLNTNGSLDTSFGTGGVTIIGNGQAMSSFTQVDLGRILIITSTELVRLTPGGNLDPDFDGDGRKPISLPGLFSQAVGLTDSQGRFLLVTNITINNVKQLRVVRVLQDGTLDPSYPNNGVTLINMQLNGRGIALDSQNRVLLPVVATPPALDPQPESLFRVIRLNASGVLDTSFDTDGQVEVSIGAGVQSARAVTVLTNNKIMMVGLTNKNISGVNDGGDFAAIRLNENGSLDTGFGTGGKFVMGFKDPRVPAPSVINPNPALQGFTELFGAVVGLPNGGALAFGSGFGNTLADGNPFMAVGKFNP